MPGNRTKQVRLLPLTCAFALSISATPAVAQQDNLPQTAPAVQDVPSETLSAMTEDPVCTAKFKWDSVEFNQEEFRSCLEKNDFSTWQEINILGWASPPGTSEYNLGLSERRANTMAEFLRSQGNELEVTLAQGRGESAEIGRAAQIFVLQRRGAGADGVAQGQIEPPEASEEQATAAPEESPEVSGAQPVNPGFATGPDANPGDQTGDNVVDVTPTPGAMDGAEMTAPIQNLETRDGATERGRDLSWLGAFGLVGLVPFLRKRRSGVR